MSDETPLNDIFSKAPVQEAVAPTPEPVVTDEPAAEVPEVEAVVEPEVAKAPEGQKPEATPSVAEDSNKVVEAFKAKALDEARKRQALEAQLQAMQTKVEKPDAMIDPEGAIAFQMSQLEQRFQNQFLNMSEVNAKARHPDFEDMKQAFFEKMLPENPVLQQQALQQPDPYGWIYNQAKNHTEIAKIGNVADWQAQKEAEIRAKIEAEYAGKLNAETEKAITKMIPGSLGKSTAAAGNKSQPWEGPTPLVKVIGK